MTRRTRRPLSPLSPRRRCAPRCCPQIMFNLEKAHMILDEMIMNGCVTETNKRNILQPVLVLEKVSSD